MLAEGDEIGRGERATHPRVNLEFVSVNPNGPLHVGHGRYAAYGDALHRLMAFSGANVSTEFYINDYGRQMDRFGRSVAARYAQSFGVDLPVPADGYQGEYVKDVAATIRAEVGDALPGRPDPGGERGRSWARGFAGRAGGGAGRGADRRRGRRRRRRPGRGRGASDWPADPAVEEAVAFFRRQACALMLDEMRAELAAFGVEFDTWFSETTLHEGGALERVVDRLLAQGRGLSKRAAPSGCGPPPAATTRTGCSSGATAARPTSPPTSPITRTSWSGASSTSSTSGAPTTTATCRA